ncbi:MAG TPA: DUF2889 domain-containing protein [Casimicrobiaceae bacterium]|nr:DUF2889 domain-containing protein [Casimicrobiaceae bacterium]
MPLPPSSDREALHLRAIEMRGYRRADGDYEIEGRITDTKTRPIHPPGRAAPMPAGTPVHDMWIRLVVDEHLAIKDVLAVTDSGPYADCPHAAAALQSLRGARIGPGWTARVKAMLGREACTHLVELLIPLATAAYQTLAHVRMARADELDANGRPVRIDSCYAYADDRDLVRRRWPLHYRPGSPR